MGLISAGFQNGRIPAIVKGALPIYGLSGLDSVPSIQGVKSDSLNPMVYGIERLVAQCWCLMASPKQIISSNI